MSGMEDTNELENLKDLKNVNAIQHSIKDDIIIRLIKMLGVFSKTGLEKLYSSEVGTKEGFEYDIVFHLRSKLKKIYELTDETEDEGDFADFITAFHLGYWNAKQEVGK